MFYILHTWASHIFFCSRFCSGCWAGKNYAWLSLHPNHQLVRVLNYTKTKHHYWWIFLLLLYFPYKALIKSKKHNIANKCIGLAICSYSVFKSAQPATWTYGYSLFYSIVYTVKYSAHNSVQCTVYLSFHYSMGMWDVQTLIASED